MDACTVTAPDVTTAFAVPNPNGPSQGPSVFSGPGVQRVAPLEPVTRPTSDRRLVWTPTLSTVDARDTSAESLIVNAQEWCNREFFGAAAGIRKSAAAAGLRA